MTLKGIKPGELLEAHLASREVTYGGPSPPLLSALCEGASELHPATPKQRGLSVRAALRSSSDAARYIGPIGAGSVAKLVHRSEERRVGKGGRSREWWSQ